jgi:hypothetical protein
VTGEHARWQERPTCFAGTCLQVRTRRDVGTQGDEVGTELAGEIRNHVGFAVRLRTQAVVDVVGRGTEACSDRENEKCAGVGSTRHGAGDITRVGWKVGGREK